MKKDLKKIIDDLGKSEYLKTENDRLFFSRVYNNGDLFKYKKRLNAIGFTNKKNILDHGCGYGQWSIALSELNSNVSSYDYDNDRLIITNQIIDNLGINNINLLNNINYNDKKLHGHFDAIFSYGVLQCLDYNKMLNHYYNLLSKKGQLYFTAADLGWYLYFIIDGHNDIKNSFSTREIGIKTISNTIEFLSTGNSYFDNNDLIFPFNSVESVLKSKGFNLIAKGRDGSINYSNENSDSFFPFKKYGNFAIFEVLCEKI